MGFHVKDFTSHCPVTGQPDFAELVIEYRPRLYLVETKSLKMFLQSYRSRREFNETIVDEIAGELFKQIDPLYVHVRGEFAYRGGISVTVDSERVGKA